MGECYARPFAHSPAGLVDRIELAVIRDPFTAFPKVKFVARRRVGGQVVLGEALRLYKVAVS